MVEPVTGIERAYSAWDVFCGAEATYRVLVGIGANRPEPARTGTNRVGCDGTVVVEQARGRGYERGTAGQVERTCSLVKARRTIGGRCTVAIATKAL